MTLYLKLEDKPNEGNMVAQSGQWWDATSGVGVVIDKLEEHLSKGWVLFFLDQKFAYLLER